MCLVQSCNEIIYTLQVQGGGGGVAKELQTLYIRVVSFAAVFRVVMQRSGGGVLRDDPKTGCGGD